jgi:hypothetical protein
VAKAPPIATGRLLSLRLFSTPPVITLNARTRPDYGTFTPETRN